jgi:dipeptidase E
MFCFLTSLPYTEETEELNPANGFLDALKRCITLPCSALYISGYPDDGEENDESAEVFMQDLTNAGIKIESISVLDSRNPGDAEALVAASGLIILDGGHVPSQNRFINSIGLRKLLQDYHGVVLGVSAGSVNSAETVYAFPVRDGEAVDLNYQRRLPGLALTKINILPHYADYKDETLDGMRFIEDIVLPDSMGRAVYALQDGSYLFTDSEHVEIRGEAYEIKDGTIRQIASDGEAVLL